MTVIKSRSLAVLFMSETATVRETLVEAVASDADLSGADLSGAKITALQRERSIELLGLVVIDS